jgi:hypothetical protein
MRLRIRMEDDDLLNSAGHELRKKRQRQAGVRTLPRIIRYIAMPAFRRLLNIEHIAGNL